MIFYVLNKDDVLVETIQSPDESGVAGITAIQGVVEEKLSTYELIELIVPADSDGLEDIEEEMAVVFKDISGWREYIIYEIEDIDGDSLETSIRAELSSSELIDEVIERDIRGISNNPTRNLEEILDNTRWLAGQVDSSLYSQPFNVDTNYMNVLEALNEYATRYGAEIRFRYEVDGNKVVRRYVDVYKQFGEYKGKIFEIDRDMTSVKRTVNTELIKTTIIPYSKELEKEYPEGEEPETKETYRIGIEDIEWKKSNGDPVDKPLGQNYLVDPLALEKWGKLNADGSRRHKKIPMEFDFDNTEAIISMAWVQLGRYTQPRVYYEVSAIDLYAMTGDEDLKHEQILLGDTGGVKDHYFSNPLEIQTRLVEVKRDLFDPRNNDYVFGDPRTIFSANASVEIAEEVAKDIEDVITRIENAQTSIDGKTKVFRGSEVPVNPEENNIWFRPHPSKQGHTQMMLFNGANWEIHVDSSDLEDAGRLTFGTIDGANINVINLIADNISGGQLKLENGIEITHKGTPILKVNNSGEVEMNISKMTINALDVEEELERYQEEIDKKASTDTVDETQTSLNDLGTKVAKKEDLGDIINALNDIAEGIKADEEVSEEISKKVENILERVPLIEQNLEDRSHQWNFIDSYISLSDDGMLIKDSSGSSGILINEKAIAFIDSNNEPVADITNDRMRINRGIFVDSVRVGQHEEYNMGNGHTITTWVGDVK